MIPATAHFVWVGSRFEWLTWAALASAAEHGGFESVVLHHTDDLVSSRWFRALSAVPRVSTSRLDATAVVEGAGGRRLVDLYRRLDAPAARSNVLRVALLLARGGVYLDTDTVTVGELSTLRREATFFCGSEHVAFPATLRRSRSVLRWSAALAKTALRDALRRAPSGVRWFRRVKALYPAVANNAVLGATRAHPFLGELVDRMLRLPHGEAVERFALGTRLLQDALAESPPEVRVHRPELFYPLGPEISEHWFRERSRATLDEVMDRETRVVHWYASVRTRELTNVIDPQWVCRERGKRLLATLLHGSLAPALREMG